MKKQFIFTTIIILTCVQLVRATMNHHLSAYQTHSVSGEDQGEFDQLLLILDKYTEIATKSKLNSEYVPGIISIVTREEMDSNGFRTVEDVLSTIPGIEISQATVGYKQIIIRGVGSTVASGNVKILVNNISINDNITGNGDIIMDMPVEHLERIEVIRGPGSAIHGEFSYTGVINVITREQGKNVFFDVGSQNNYTWGYHLSHKSADDDFRMQMSLSRSKTGGHGNISGKDVLYRMNQADISKAPGTINDKRENLSGLASFRYKNFSVTGQYMSANMGSHFSSTFALMPDNGNTVFHKNLFFIESRQIFDLTSDLNLALKQGFMDVRYKDKDVILFPSGFYGVYPDGLRATYFTQERRFKGAFELTYSGIDKHNILLGYEYNTIELTDSWANLNFHPLTQEPLPFMQRFDDEETNGLPVGLKRKLHSIFFQDEFHLIDNLTITTGLRFDHYNDAGDTFTPRLAGVYRMNTNHILKIQYASAFRPPSFLEMYLQNTPGLEGNRDIEPSLIDTYELCYIYKKNQILGRISFFHSVLDKIVNNENGKYINSGEAKVSGSEIEMEHPLGNHFKLNANCTFLFTEDKKSNEKIPFTASLLGNASLLFAPKNNISFSILGRYVGKRSRELLDSREDLSDYGILDLSGCIYHLWEKEIKVRAGISNLFDTTIRYPSPMQSYPDDFPSGGREYWLKMSGSF